MKDMPRYINIIAFFAVIIMFYSVFSPDSAHAKSLQKFSENVMCVPKNLTLMHFSQKGTLLIHNGTAELLYPKENITGEIFPNMTNWNYNSNMTNWNYNLDIGWKGEKSHFWSGK